MGEKKGTHKKKLNSVKWWVTCYSDGIWLISAQLFLQTCLRSKADASSSPRVFLTHSQLSSSPFKCQVAVSLIVMASASFFLYPSNLNYSKKKKKSRLNPNTECICLFVWENTVISRKWPLAKAALPSPLFLPPNQAFWWISVVTGIHFLSKGDKPRRKSWLIIPKSSNKNKQDYLGQSRWSTFTSRIWHGLN